MRKSYLLKGYNTIPLIGKKYCASGCEHWEPNVTQFYRELGGNPALLTYAPMGSPVVVAGTPTPDAQPDPTPVATPKAQAITISAKVVKVVEPEKSWLGRKSAATQVDVEAVIAPNEPLAKSVKLVRVTPQGAKELAVLRQEGRDENNAYVFSGSGSFEPGEQKSVDLQVVAGFAKPKGRTVTSNAMTVTVVCRDHCWRHDLRWADRGCRRVVGQVEKTEGRGNAPSGLRKRFGKQRGGNNVEVNHSSGGCIFRSRSRWRHSRADDSPGSVPVSWCGHCSMYGRVADR
jgi:hypothetical protein